MEKIYFVVMLCLVYEVYRRRRNYYKLYDASRHLLIEHYTSLLVKKMEYLQSIRSQSDYDEIFKTISSGLRDEMSLLPKEIKSLAWGNAVNEHTHTQPPAMSGEEVYGRAIWYNEIKKAIGIKRW